MLKRLCILGFVLFVVGSAVWANGSAEKKPLVWVWLPNDSPPESAPFRAAMDKIVSDAIGRPVVDKLTTDYNIAIQAMTSDNAALALFGPYQYIKASQITKTIVPLVTNTGDSGTLADAVYYSRIVVKTENADQYMRNGKYSLDNIQGKMFSFVSNSSTSGFLFPATGVAAYFAKMSQWASLKASDLMEGGAGKLFNQVLFGGSHQGSLANVISGKADVGACDDVDTDTYDTVISGQASTPGAVYQIKSDAAEPFDAYHGAQFTVIWSVPVLNGPIAVNSNLLSKDEMSKITAAFDSDATMKNTDIFAQPNSNSKADFTQTGKVRFVPVTDATYQPVRDMIQ
ncbi:MAG: PhnD/SsuA/transferrin family substrate-binding protein [Spirochaetia bacterium]